MQVAVPGDTDYANKPIIATHTPLQTAYHPASMCSKATNDHINVEWREG